MVSPQGFFAKPEIGGPAVAGVFYKLPPTPTAPNVYTNGKQLGWQIVGIIITMGYTAWVTLCLVRFTFANSLSVDCFLDDTR